MAVAWRAVARCRCRGWPPSQPACGNVSAPQAEEARLLAGEHADGAGGTEQRRRPVELAAAVVGEGEEREAERDALRLPDGPLARGLAQRGLEQRHRVVRPAEQQRALGHELLPCGLLRGGGVEPRQGEAVRRHLVRVRVRGRGRVRVREKQSAATWLGVRLRVGLGLGLGLECVLRLGRVPEVGCSKGK